MQKIPLSFLALTLFLGGVFLGREFFSLPSPQEIKTAVAFASGASEQSLTNPLLLCSNLPTAIPQSKLIEYHATIARLLDAEKAADRITSASVYYRDLNNGPWTAVGEEEHYAAASLLKVPLAISFYKKAEAQIGLLDSTTTYVADPSVVGQVQPYAPTENVVNGRVYSIRDLVRIMLEQSSNEAAETLVNHSSRADVIQIYQDLGLRSPDFDKDYFISAHDFSSFFRTLYNASYLDRNDSQTILNFLAKATYKEGLVAGVPNTTTVAHKFGSRKLSDGSIELHDCGIVYEEGSPYALCVMTKGWDFTKLSAVVKRVSQITYTYAIQD